jgi:uncharacterized protein
MGSGQGWGSRLERCGFQRQQRPLTAPEPIHPEPTRPALTRPALTGAPLDRLGGGAGMPFRALLTGGAVQRLWPAAALLGGGVLLVDSLHGPLSSLFSLSAAAGGLWLLAGRLRPSGAAQPRSSSAWLERLEAVLTSFEQLQPEAQADQLQRRQELAQLRERQGRRQLELALVGAQPWCEASQRALLTVLRCPLPLRLLRSEPLPVASEHWQWPEAFRRCDHLLLRLNLPLSAADLRWLEAVPAGQELWLLVDRPRQGELEHHWAALLSQLPPALRERCWPWSPERAEQLPADLADLAGRLSTSDAGLLERTLLRNLQDLHGAWQVELEGLRRRQWAVLLQRTQWTVAAGVVVAPLPSLDLLVLAAANGLMLQEMARLWNCSWSLEQLQAAALQLARAALSLGVVEWSSQALGAVVKLHGATWLVGGALQALSAAYLTRVVGHAMADYLALAAGVPEEELEGLLQRQAPLLVSRAAEAERLDWAGFLQQGRQWWQTLSLQLAAAGETTSAPSPAPQA